VDTEKESCGKELETGKLKEEDVRREKGY